MSTVVAHDKGQNYAIGDEITITAAGGTGLTITVSDIDGQGVVKPSAGKDILCDTTRSLVIPSKLNQRPTALDRVTGAIGLTLVSYSLKVLGSDFVSLGGVRDVDQDTFVLTEVSLAQMKIRLNFSM